MTGSSLSRIRILVARERTELLRDRVSLAIIFALPLLTLALFTFALATDVKNMSLAVFDASGSPHGRALVQSIESTHYFDVRRVSSLRDAEARIAAGEVAALLIIPPDVEERFAKGQVAEAQLLIDGSQSVLAANAESILAATVAAFERNTRRALELPQGDLGGAPSTQGYPAIEQRAVFNPRLDSEHFMVPGLLGYIFTFLTILIAAVSIVRERTMGTFEQLLVTPVAASEIIIAKLIVLGIAMLINEAFVMLMGGLCFDVWPRGSVALLFGSTALYLLVTLSIGLLLSARSKTPEEAIQKAVVAATPLLNVSGLVFPVSAMPYGFQVFAHILPVSHYIDSTRAIYLTGAGPLEIAPHLAVIATWVVVLGALLVRVLGKERGG